MESSKEIWADIDGYSGLYQVSNIGRIKSLGGKSNHNSEMIMKQQEILGYMSVTLRKDDISKMFKVHRLVANAFIDNPLNKPQVNHIDGNKRNNAVSNLEWVTPSENAKHAFEIGLKKSQSGKDNKRSIAIERIDNNGIVLDEYCGFREAERITGIPHSNISKCCRGEAQSAGGYKWRIKLMKVGI